MPSHSWATLLPHKRLGGPRHQRPQTHSGGEPHKKASRERMGKALRPRLLLSLGKMQGGIGEEGMQGGPEESTVGYTGWH